MHTKINKRAALLLLQFRYLAIASTLLAGLFLNNHNSYGNDLDKPVLTSSVGNFVWFDYDRDSRQDAGEPGVVGVEVVLYDGDGQVIATTRTDAGGNYSFTGLNTEPAGKLFRILFKLPPGLLFSQRYPNIPDIENSDADETTGKTNLFTLLPGQVNDNFDAGLVGTNAILPLHRLELNTVLVSNHVKVTWEAENELNTTIFVVQRSNNGLNFTDIASKPPTGPVNTPTTYQVIDYLQGLSNAGSLYYRIKAMDSDGRIAFSKVTLIKLKSGTSANIFPNPITDRLNVAYTATVSSRLQITLTNASGDIIRELNLNVNPGHNQVEFNDMDRLPAGLYVVRIYDRSLNEIHISRITK